MHVFIATISAGLRPLKQNEEDIALLQRISKGEETALSDVYDRYGQLLYSSGLRMLRSVEETEDIVQDVFLQVWNKAHSYSASKGTVYTWLVTMVRKRALDRLRSRGSKHQSQHIDMANLLITANSSSSSSQNKSIMNEHQHLVANALKTLSVDHHQVLGLAYYEGYSQTEIAEKLNIPISTVKSRVKESLLTMRNYLVEKK